MNAAFHGPLRPLFMRLRLYTRRARHAGRRRKSGDHIATAMAVASVGALALMMMIAGVKTRSSAPKAVCAVEQRSRDKVVEGQGRLWTSSFTNLCHITEVEARL